MLLLVPKVWSQAAEPSACLELKVDASHVTGGINRELLGVNHGPLSVYQPGALYNGSNALDLSTWYREAGIRRVRLDEFGYIDFQAFFPNFAADPDKPENYRFEVADRYLQAIVDAGADIFFRLGYSEKHQAAGVGPAPRWSISGYMPPSPRQSRSWTRH